MKRWLFILLVLGSPALLSGYGWERDKSYRTAHYYDSYNALTLLQICAEIHLFDESRFTLRLSQCCVPPDEKYHLEPPSDGLATYNNPLPFSAKDVLAHHEQVFRRATLIPYDAPSRIPYEVFEPPDFLPENLVAHGIDFTMRMPLRMGAEPWP